MINSQTNNQHLIIVGGFALLVILCLSLTAWTMMQTQEWVELSLPKILNGTSTSTSPSPKNLETQTSDDATFPVPDGGFLKHGAFDPPLAAAIIKFLKNEGIWSVLEFGCGTGAYAKLIKAAGIEIHGYDGNPETQTLSEGRCGVADLSKPLDFAKSDFVMSLEVIPSENEDIVISNLDAGNRRGLIVSWAVEFEGGMSHFDNRNNSYIRNKLTKKGYIADLEAERKLRAAAQWYWFKSSLMVFRRNKIP